MPKAETKAFLDDGPKQYFMLVEKTALNSVDDVQNDTTFYHLRHPCTDKQAIFLFTHSHSNVFEVHNFKEEFRSWLIDNTVVEDGSLLLITPVDPLFLILPYIMNAEKKTGKFMTLDQIIEDEEYSDTHHLPDCIRTKHLRCVADIKGSGDIQACRYSEKKTLSWLQKKVQRVADVLSENRVPVSEGTAHSMTYVKSKKDNESSREDNLIYAHGLVSEYISEELQTRLKESLGLKDPEESKCTRSEEPPPKKRVKTENSSGPAEDYSKNNKSVKPPKTPKLLVSQKKLCKVDKSGMKSISSFFSAKPKT